MPPCMGATGLSEFFSGITAVLGCLHVTCLKELPHELVCNSSNLFLLFGKQTKAIFQTATGRTWWVHQTIPVEPTMKFITVGLRFFAISGCLAIPMDKHEFSFCLLQGLNLNFLACCACSEFTKSTSVSSSTHK